jgi:ATP-dependent DNA ligase
VIKHDGYRLMVRRDGSRVRAFTRNGHDWGIVSLPLSKTLKAQSFLIDGEAVIIGGDGTHDFRALRSRGRKAMLVAFNVLELDGDDLRSLPLIARKRRLARLIGRAKRPAIQYGEHLTGDGPTVFAHVSKLGLEGLSRSGRTRRIALVHRGRGSSRRTRRARRCAGSARRNGTKQGSVG